VADGKKSEVLVLPATLVVLVALSVFVAFSFRNTVTTLAAERRQEAESMALALASELAGGTLPGDHELARRRGDARAVALLDVEGVPLATSGDYLGPPATPAAELSWWRAATTPARRTISAIAPVAAGERELTLQVDLPAPTLAAAERAVRVLTPVVLVVDSALLLLAGLYLRHVLAPFDRLLRRARASGRVPAASDDLSFLLATFEAAVEALATPPEDDLEALERTLARGVESGLLLLDAGGGVLTLNDAGAALLEVAPPAPGTALEALLAPHPAVSAALAAAIREGRGLERQELALGTGERTLGLTLHPLRRDDGAVRGYLAFFVDLTAARRQAAERQLAESLRQLGELSAGMAHEMRNSLATLRGYLTLIERGGEGDEVSEYVAEIRHETDHVKRVLDDFLAFARPESARLEKLDLERLVHRAAADPALGGMAVRVSGEGWPLLVDGDAQLLERAFRNLLHNAAEAERGAGREGPLEVAVHAAAGGVEVAVGDRGGGLPDEMRDRLFQPFASHRPGGVGLGLALAQRIVQLHGGGVTLEVREGGGVEARVRLPLGAVVTDRNDSASPDPVEDLDGKS